MHDDAVGGFHRRLHERSDVGIGNEVDPIRMIDGGLCRCDTGEGLWDLRRPIRGLGGLADFRILVGRWNPAALVVLAGRRGHVVRQFPMLHRRDLAPHAGLVLRLSPAGLTPLARLAVLASRWDL